MKKLAVLCAICICITNLLFSQDLIVLKNGDEIKSKVTEITQSEIKYKKFDNQDGPTISISKSQVFMIKYQNGTKDVINASKPAQENEQKTFNNKNSKPNTFGIYVNPLGFIEFGPMAGAEIKLGSRLIIDGHVRYSPLGVLMYVLTADDDEGWADKITGMGAGGGLKYFHPSRIGGFYTGALFEYGWQSQTFAQEKTWVWKEEATYVVAMASIGYKFKFPSGFFINTGAQLGTEIGLTNKWHYLKNYNNDSKIHIDDNEVHPFGLLEVGLGFEF